MSGGVLVAGVGNVFLGDDGFGVALARRLADEPMPPGVQVADYGIRGLHLALDLLDGRDALVLLDAVPLDGPPGTVAVLEVEVPPPPPEGAPSVDTPSVDAHAMSPDAVLATLAALGGTVPRVVVVGCRPAEVVERMGLSAPVAGAVEHAVPLVRVVVAALVGAGGATPDGGTAPDHREERVP